MTDSQRLEQELKIVTDLLEMKRAGVIAGIHVRGIMVGVVWPKDSRPASPDNPETIDFMRFDRAQLMIEDWRAGRGGIPFEMRNATRLEKTAATMRAKSFRDRRQKYHFAPERKQAVKQPIEQSERRKQYVAETGKRA